MSFRVGIGYDVHKLVEGRSLVLGGVEISFEKGLLGHSDADVLVHAIMDALLGAAGLGDIGIHFPDTDEKFLSISSLELLKKVDALLSEAGFEIINIDAVVVAQSPRLSPHRALMVKNIAQALNISTTMVNIKAKTEEGLGFTGMGQGIAAHAVCMLQRC